MNAIIDDLKDRELPIIRQNRIASQPVTHIELEQAIANCLNDAKRYTRHWVRDRGDSA